MAAEVVSLAKVRAEKRAASDNAASPPAEPARQVVLEHGTVRVTALGVWKRLDDMLEELKDVRNILRHRGIPQDNVFEKRYQDLLEQVDAFRKIFPDPRLDSTLDPIARLTSEADKVRKTMMANIQSLITDVFQAAAWAMKQREMARLIEEASDGIEPQQVRYLRDMRVDARMSDAILYARKPTAIVEQSRKLLEQTASAIARGDFDTLKDCFHAVERTASTFFFLKQALEKGDLVRTDLLSKE